MYGNKAPGDQIAIATGHRISSIPIIVPFSFFSFPGPLQRLGRWFLFFVHTCSASMHVLRRTAAENRKHQYELRPASSSEP
jgi:hypothetical protein